MEKKLDQRVCLKFCVANGISCSESLRMLRNRFKENCMSKTQAYDWYKSFKEGREFVNDMPRSGRPSTSTTEENIECVKRIVLEHGNIGIRKISAKLNISYGSTKHILAELSRMKSIATRTLTSIQKDHRLNIAKELISKADNDSTFFKRIITGGETCICENMQFPANQSDARNLQRNQTEIKIVFSVFFDYHGLLHYEFLPDQHHNIDDNYYFALLSRLYESIQKQRPDLWKTNSFILHLDSAITQRAVVGDFITKQSIQIIEKVQYSIDLSPFDFFLVPRLKIPLKKGTFESSEDIKNNLLRELDAIPSKAYQKCMDDWSKRWQMCVASNGDHFDES